MPSVMLKVAGVSTSVRKAGIASVGSSQGISRTAESMNVPTRTSAGATMGYWRNVSSVPDPRCHTTGTDALTVRAIGSRKSPESMRRPVVTAVRPGRPPAATPAAPSPSAVTADVPTRPATAVPHPAARKAAPAGGAPPAPQETCLRGHAHERADRVEEIGEEEHEDDRENPEAARHEPGQVHVERGRCERGRELDDAVDPCQAEPPGGD